MTIETTWLRFVLAPEQNPKTSVHLVLAKDGDAELGQVRWFGRWRRYAFFPAIGTIYEPTCLRDIADFCERQTLSHKAVKA